jgi:hypothetical protein
MLRDGTKDMGAGGAILLSPSAGVFLFHNGEERIGIGAPAVLAKTVEAFPTSVGDWDPTATSLFAETAELLSATGEELKPSKCTRRRFADSKSSSSSMSLRRRFWDSDPGELARIFLGGVFAGSGCEEERALSLEAEQIGTFGGDVLICCVKGRPISPLAS